MGGGHHQGVLEVGMGNWLAGGPVQTMLETGPNWTEMVSALAAAIGVLATVAIFWARSRRRR